MVWKTGILPDTAAGGSFPGAKCPGTTLGKFSVELVKIAASLINDRKNAMLFCKQWRVHSSGIYIGLNEPFGQAWREKV